MARCGVFPAGLGDVADLAAGGGVVGLERLADGGVDVLTVDEELVVGHGWAPSHAR